MLDTAGAIPRTAVFSGRAEKILPGFPDDCADSVVTDPPYGLAPLKTKTVTAALSAWLSGDRLHVPDGRGFMSREWDRFVPPPGIWDECYRILRPGGWLLAFAAPRTQDLMGLSIRLAGFEVTDSLHWIYGNGFPKGSARLKPAHEPILMAWKPDKRAVPIPGIDGCRIAHQNGENPSAARRAGKAPGREIGSWANDRRSAETFAAEHPGESDGRWPPNLLLTHDSTCNGECVPGCPVPVLDAQSGILHARGNRKPSVSGGGTGNSWSTRPVVADHGPGDAGGASRFFPQFAWDPEFDDLFRYQAKAPKSERPVLPDGTGHPTCKPLALMRWLVRLVTPPGGLVLDPFAGTGTTLHAALLEGFRSFGVDDWPAAVEMARIRLADFSEAAFA